MARKRLKGSAEAIAKLARDPRRGELCLWLYDEHDAIVERTFGKRMPWKTLLDQVQALGLTTASGNPVESIETLRSAWKRVQVAKRREAEARQQKAAQRRPPVTNRPPPMVPASNRLTKPQPVPDGMDPLEVEILRRSNRRV